MQVLCRVLTVSTAGYYQWRQRPAVTAVSWHPAAQAAFAGHARRYGTRRLRAEGHTVGRYALRSWLHHQGLHALSTRPQRPRTTVADPAAVVAENRLLSQPAPTAPDRVWVGDITYLPPVGGRCTTWPLGAIPVLGGSWAGTWLRRCPPSAAGFGADPDPAPARAGAPRPRQSRQLIQQRRLPRLHRSSRGRTQLQPAGQPLRQRPTGYGPDRSRLEHTQNRTTTPRHCIYFARRSPPGSGSLPRYLL